MMRATTMTMTMPMTARRVRLTLGVTLLLGTLGCGGNLAGPSSTPTTVTTPATVDGQLCTPSYHPRGCPQPSVTPVIVVGR